MADKENTEEETPPAPKSNKKLLIFGLLGLLVAGGGGAGGAYYMGAKSSATPAPVEGEAEPQAALPDEALYVALYPAFTVNFTDEGNSRFLQVELEAMTRDPSVLESIEQNMPMIRNNLVMLLSSKDANQLSTSDGKEELREQTRLGIQEVVAQEGTDGTVEAVFFTSFVMQ